MTQHAHQTIHHTAAPRTLEVLRVETLTPHMRRVVFGSESLHGFPSAAPDDHVALIFPNGNGDIVRPMRGEHGLAQQAGVVPSPVRSYTPRHYDPQTRELTIDFVLHGNGPATRWAAQAAPGQVLGADGPVDSTPVADDFDGYVLMGDETALPAISRWLEEMPAATRVRVFIEIADQYARQEVTSRTEFELTWPERNGVDPAASTLLEDALAAWTLPAGETFYWIAAERARAQALHQALSARGVPDECIRATGYWQAGVPGESPEIGAAAMNPR